MKTYVITLSKYFPSTHMWAGIETNFKEKFLCGEKIHTIRGNYELWEKRIKEVQDGRAALSIREWTGRPYWSQQIEIAQLTAKNGVGLQKLEFYGNCAGLPHVDGICVKGENLAQNDGLLSDGWDNWFRKCGPNTSLAIIHFTKFRY